MGIYHGIANKIDLVHWFCLKMNVYPPICWAFVIGSSIKFWVTLHYQSNSDGARKSQTSFKDMNEDGWVQWVWRSHQGASRTLFCGCPTCSVTDYIPSGSFGQADLEWKSSTHILETLQSYWHSLPYLITVPGALKFRAFLGSWKLMRTR